MAEVQEARSTKEALIWNTTSDDSRPSRAALIKSLKDRRLQEERLSLARTVLEPNQLVWSRDDASVSVVKARSPPRTEAQDAFCLHATTSFPNLNESGVAVTRTTPINNHCQMYDAFAQTDETLLIGKKKTEKIRHSTLKPTVKIKPIPLPEKTTRTKRMTERTSSRRLEWNSSIRLQRPSYQRSIRTDEPFLDLSSSLSVNKKADESSHNESIRLNESHQNEMKSTETSLKEMKSATSIISTDRIPTTIISTDRITSSTSLIQLSKTESFRNYDGLLTRLKKSTMANSIPSNQLQQGKTYDEIFHQSATINRRLSESNLFRSSNGLEKSTKRCRSLSSRDDKKQRIQPVFGLASDSPALIRDRRARDRLQILTKQTTSMSSSN